MAALTLHFLDDLGHTDAAIKRIRAVERVAMDMYDERDEDGHLRDFEHFEAMFISTVNAISKDYSKVRFEGFLTWGNGAAYDALCNITYREEADKLEGALATYKAERERFFND